MKRGRWQAIGAAAIAPALAMSLATAQAEVKRWQGSIDAEGGRALAGRDDFALGCNRTDGLFMMVPLGPTMKPADTPRLLLVIDGREFAMAQIAVFDDDGGPVLVAHLGRDDPVVMALRRGLKLAVVTDAGKSEVGLYGAAPLIRDMLKACFG